MKGIKAIRDRESSDFLHSCLALLTQDDQGWSLTLSNPLNEAGLVNLTINNQDPIQVPFPDGLLAGSSVTVRLPKPSKNGK